MKEQEIKPHKITKPIQLLSAWLVGLILINGSFLGTAVAIGNETYLNDFLVIASILNVPIFIFSIFLLQTKYRPEMQEDLFYSQYLDRKTNQIVGQNRLEIIDSKLETIGKAITIPKKVANTKSKKAHNLDVQVNDYLPKLDSIRKLLKSKNLKIQEYFGGVNDSKAPQNWIIAINEKLELPEIAPLIKELFDLGIDCYSVFDPLEVPNQADLYIGSYGNPDGNFDKEIIEKLHEWDMSDLRHHAYVSSKGA